jgi:hypothetical protein
LVQGLLTFRRLVWKDYEINRQIIVQPAEQGLGVGVGGHAGQQRFPDFVWWSP